MAERVWSGGASASAADGLGDGDRESDEEYADNFLAGAKAAMERLKKSRKESGIERPRYTERERGDV